ncbi:MFS general substrate transporter [Glarea lozoyensis ATCC 20868]|uniref:MFS general substrate transporter n=1 Tax=Glarea lozoyensis (strain ATCC 20868 / MF5171) TaxID=1116229 RepID=S3D132_GLAL2|nr:MFS general substrate transporter [Glarea lozoyensis ATCC 20868]EPE32227.1 MFS general substrate transporter [Glarea lozoyensis ATCC 20868]
MASSTMDASDLKKEPHDMVHERKTVPDEDAIQNASDIPQRTASLASNETRSSISPSELEKQGNTISTQGGAAEDLNVDNPLLGLRENEIDDKVKEYTDTSRHLRRRFELLKSGAHLANNTDNALSDKSLFPDSYVTEEQSDYLRKRETYYGFWHQSKYLKGSVLSACLAGIIQGWTQSAMNGANIGIRAEFGLHDQVENGVPRVTKDLWIFGLMNAIPFIAGGIFAPFVSDFLQEHFFGRRGAIAIACFVSIGATVGQCFSTSVAQIIGCRVVTGLTLAAKASSAPLLAAEVAPNHLRGKLLSTWQLSDAFGIFLGFSANLAIQHMHARERIMWRVQIGVTLIPIIVLLFLVYFMPESPRYLMKRGRPSKALDSFILLRPSPAEEFIGARDFIYAHFQLEMECKSSNDRMEKRKQKKEEKRRKKHPSEPPQETTQPKKEETREEALTEKLRKEKQNEDPERGEQFVEKPAIYAISETHWIHRVLQTFRDSRSRRALVCASTAMISQQLCGINTIAFLSATLLSSTTNTSPYAGAWVGFGIGACNFVFGLPAFYLLDKVGRATMLLCGFIPMFVFMLILAFSFKEDATGTTIARVPLVAVFGLLFVIAYSPTAGTSPFAISAEVFPLVVREVGHSFAVSVNFIGLGIMLLVFPSLSDAMGGYRGSLSLFAALNLVALVLCYLFVPETKGRTLEELRTIFDISTRKHVRYRLTVVTPWLFNRLLTILHIKKSTKRSALGSRLYKPKREGWIKTLLRKMVDMPLKQKPVAAGEGEVVVEGVDGEQDVEGRYLIKFHDWARQQV